jgi:hypothetical protein
VVISYSDRCFPEKAVLIWLMGDENDHRILVRAYLESAGFDDIHDEALASPDDPMFLVWALT